MNELQMSNLCHIVYRGASQLLNEKFAARINIPGLVTIESAKQDGVPLEVSTFWKD